MAQKMMAGSAIGSVAGGIIGGIGGFETGPGEAAIIPGSVKLGFGGGATLGTGYGYFKCGTGGGSGGGGGGGADPKASESANQMAEASKGKGRAIAGAGTAKPLRDAARLAKEYGGSPADWRKMATSNAVNKGLDNFEIHYYQNIRTGEVVEMKTVPLSLRQ